MSSSDFGPAWVKHRKASGGTDDNATLVSATAKRLGTFYGNNINAAIRYVKLYDKATAPTSSDTPLMTIALPASGPAQHFNFGPRGLALVNGLGYRIVTGAADSDNTASAANEQFFTLGYL